MWNSSHVGETIDCQRTHWMHTAKTSSMFCLAIQHACCPVAYEKLTAGITLAMLNESVSHRGRKSEAPQFGYNSSYCFRFYRSGHPELNCQFAGRPEHNPLHHSLNLDHHFGMAIVREPKSRVVSAFLDAVHLEGFANRTHYHKLREKIQQISANKTIPRLERLLIEAQMYADYPGLYGHQVKMLTGEEFWDLSKRDDPRLDKVLARAINRLSKFFFVGIFDEYARSLRLFHALANKGEVISVIGWTPVQRDLKLCFIFSCVFADRVQ
jgi:hypothetical protein